MHMRHHLGSDFPHNPNPFVVHHEKEHLGGPHYQVLDSVVNRGLQLLHVAGALGRGAIGSLTQAVHK